jgi:hypothetical protein
LIFTKSVGDPATDKVDGQYYAIVYTLADTPTYVTYSHTLPFNSEYGIFRHKIMDSIYGNASVVMTNAGLVCLTGANKAIGAYSESGISNSLKPLWEARTGIFTNLGRVKYYLQNGRVINKRDEYTDPRGEKDAANYNLEEITVNGEVQDNGLDPDTGTFTGTYDGTVKTTGDYEINLLTGEILFVSPPRMNTIVKAHYDYKPSVQYFRQEKANRWETIRDLAQSVGALVYTTSKGRVGYAERRKVDDHVFTSASAETYQLTGKNIVHSSNPAYNHDTIQVSNGEHNYFYVQGTDFTISYNAVSGVYTLTEVGSALDGHIVITYYAGPSDDSLHVFDAKAQVRPPNMITPGDERWSFNDIFNQVVVVGERAFPMNTPVTILESFAVSPNMLNAESGFSKVQKAVGSAQYRWNSDDQRFMFDTDDDQADAGFIVRFQEPMIIGTTQWRLRGPDTAQVETDTQSYPGPDAAQWVKFSWGSTFFEPGSGKQTTNYDVIVTNKNFWRVAVASDEEEILAQAGVPGTDKWKTGSYCYIKKFRDGGVPSDSCTAYAYKVKDTFYYIDKVGRLRTGELAAVDNPRPSASPDKTVRITVEPLDERGAHMFPTPGTYDGVSIAAQYCLNISAVRITYDGISADVYNYATEANYIRFTVVGYPIADIERVQVKTEERIRLDGAISAIEARGQRPLEISNPFCQSVATGRTIGFQLMDWAKEFHSETPLVSKFNPFLELLQVCLISSDYGNYDETSELWLIDGITHVVHDGDSGQSVTQVYPLDIPTNPSLPAAGS